MRGLRAGFACAALAATGCFFPGRVGRDAHSAAYAVDGALVAAGVGILISVASAPDEDDLEWKHSLDGFAAGIIAAGGAGILLNTFMPSPAERPAPPPPPRVADPARLELMRSWTPPIVDVADPKVIRFDGLARAAAAYGDCDVATTLMAEIQSSAPRYYAVAVVPDPLLALCARR